MKKTNLNEKKIIKLIRDRYKKRLMEVALSETDLYDKRGNMLLSQGLKVRHKAAGYEYTVDHVQGEGDEAIIYLRHPETPRFESPEQLSESGATINLKGIDFGRITGDNPEGNGMSIDQVTSRKVDQEKEAELNLPKASLLRITKKEFEEEYEVD